MMRTKATAGLLFGLAVTACGPKATLTQASPISRLESYRTLLVRVGYNPNDPGAPTQVNALEYIAADRLRQVCRFDRVVMYSEQTEVHPDLIMDLNIQRLYRGADPNNTGVLQMSNPGQATAEVALMLSDGINDELIGSAQVQGKSATLASTSPEAQAITVVADKVAHVLKASGCGLERVARPAVAADEPAVKPPVDPYTTSEGGDAGPSQDPADTVTADQQTTEDVKAKAESLNDEGKVLFRQANAGGAATKFQAAIDTYEDARYYFNLCLAREAQGQIAQAIAACERISSMSTSERVLEKAEERLRILRDR